MAITTIAVFLTVLINSWIVDSDLLAVVPDRVLVRTQHRSRTPTEKQALDRLAERRPFEGESVIHNTGREATTGAVYVQLGMCMMNIRYTNQLRL